MRLRRRDLPRDEAALTRRGFGRMLAGAAAMTAIPGIARSAIRISGRRAEIITFDDLPDWRDDDHGAALDVWMKSCDRARMVSGLCRRGLAPGAGIAPRLFFEREFTPVIVGTSARPLFTGYYEPVIAASRVRTPHFHVPLYGPPHDLGQRQPYFSRAEIQAGALAGQGLEIFWLADRVETYFLQIQGSGRLNLADGSVVRIGFAGKNGHPYRSIGAAMRRSGNHAEAMTAGGVKAWLRADPARGAAMMAANPSYVFFREIPDLDPGAGPLGALGVSLTNLRSIALDRSVYPFGLPHWVEAGALNRLMIGQDTGSAIRGAQRADIYFGSGREAGRAASRMYAAGRMVTLVPRARVAELIGGSG